MYGRVHNLCSNAQHERQVDEKKPCFASGQALPCATAVQLRKSQLAPAGAAAVSRNALPACSACLPCSCCPAAAVAAAGHPHRQPQQMRL